MMEAFLLCFIPLFATVDPPGMLPVFMNITSGYTPERRRRITLEAIPTAMAIGVLFILAGRPLLSFLDIGVPDLQIAGGVLLFIYAVMDLFIPGKPMVHEDQSLGVVPLATPLIVGPAVMTLCLVLRDRYGVIPTVSALGLNLLITMVLFLLADRMVRWIPLNALRALSKVVDVLLAAIGVGIVRAGLAAVLTA